MNKRNAPRKREYLPELPDGAKRIPGFETNPYFVSPEGLILSPSRHGYQIRRSVLGKDGYLRIILSFGNQKLTTKYPHRIVAEAFVPGYEPGFTVNHKNLHKTDNRASNLEWISFRDNQLHWRATNPEAAKKANERTGLRVSRPIFATDPENGQKRRFDSVKSAALWANGDSGNISHAARSKKKAYQFLWKYAPRRRKVSSPSK